MELQHFGYVAEAGDRVAAVEAVEKVAAQGVQRALAGGRSATTRADSSSWSANRCSTRSSLAGKYRKSVGLEMSAAAATSATDTLSKPRSRNIAMAASETA